MRGDCTFAGGALKAGVPFQRRLECKMCAGRTSELRGIYKRCRKNLRGIYEDVKAADSTAFRAAYVNLKKGI